MTQASDTNEKYWAEYDGLQYSKHQLLSNYLGGWFPILSSWNGRILYIDCHAGRGRHRGGQVGSPILALSILLNHQVSHQILANTQVCFIFFENDQGNYEFLETEIEQLGELPENVNIHLFNENYETGLNEILQKIKNDNQTLAPTFAFIDPYGFSLSMDICNELLSFPKCELLINFMFRYIDMAIHNPAQEANLDRLFGTIKWRELEAIDNYDGRIDSTLSLFGNQLKSEYITNMFMRASNGNLKYVLIHATNNRRGREVMKDAIWKVTPDGTFTASENHNPDQLILIEPEPDLKPLEDILLQNFSNVNIKMDELYNWLLGNLFRKPHLHNILRKLRDSNLLEFTDYTGKFAFSKNPLVTFKARNSI